MDLLNILKRLQAFIFMGIVILVYFKFTEGFGHYCPTNKFRCPDTGDCYDQSFLCNGVKNCRDGFDEKYCKLTDPSVVCPVDALPWFKCSDKTQCYPRQFRCNGVKNCRDGSDEVEDECVFRSMSYTGAFDADKTATTILLNTRNNHSTIIYGQHVTKVALALFSSSFFRLYIKLGNINYMQEITGELSVQLMSKLALKKKISTYELSQYISALIVTCFDPSDFFGFNLVSDLRKRVNQSNSINPFAILTLCNARDTMISGDVWKLKTAYLATLGDTHFYRATQAIVTMAMACISSQSSSLVSERAILDMVRGLLEDRQSDGTVQNLRTTALVIQALLATDNYQSDSYTRWAVNMLADKVKSQDVTIQDIYYFLPVFNHMSLIDISSDHCEKQTKTDMEVMEDLQDLQEGYIQVQFSIYIGNEKNFVRTWKLKVPSTHNFYEVLQIVSTLEPGYKITYGTSPNGKPHVFSVGKFYEDAEEGNSWFIYTQPLSSQGNFTLNRGSPVDIPVKATEELILWYKTVDWCSVECTATESDDEELVFFG